MHVEFRLQLGQQSSILEIRMRGYTMENYSSKKIILSEMNVPAGSEEIFEKISNLRELLLTYNSAIREVTTKLEILNDELSVRNRRNPIQFIKSRVKTPMSIVDKLQKLEKEISVESVMTSLNDVAGIRVIASFVDDVYEIADMLTKQDDVFLIEAKDYIKNPKPNGYRSYHLIVEVPVFFSDKKQFVRVEIQIRTVAMDFWASLEHQLKYKENIKNSEEIEAELRQCAETIANTDMKMMSIRNKIGDKYKSI